MAPVAPGPSLSLGRDPWRPGPPHSARHPYRNRPAPGPLARRPGPDTPRRSAFRAGEAVVMYAHRGAHWITPMWSGVIAGAAAPAIPRRGGAVVRWGAPGDALVGRAGVALHDIPRGAVLVGIGLRGRVAAAVESRRRVARSVDRSAGLEGEFPMVEPKMLRKSATRVEIVCSPWLNKDDPGLRGR